MSVCCNAATADDNDDDDGDTNDWLYTTGERPNSSREYVLPELPR